MTYAFPENPFALVKYTRNHAALSISIIIVASTQTQ
jgi:hypothetical protein